jgi:ankyrin
VQLEKLYQLLITPGVDVDLPGGWEMDTPLCTAVKEGCLVVVKLLLEHGANPHAKSGIFKCTAMHKTIFAYCTFDVKRSIIFELLAHHADINARTREGITALHSACRVGDIDIVMLLLQLGARIDVVTLKGQTALMRAVENMYEQHSAVDVVRLLIQYGADVLAVDSNNGTLLHTMVTCESMRNLPLARFLIENGVQDGKDIDGMTAGDFAKSYHDHMGTIFSKHLQRMFAEHKQRLVAFAFGNRQHGRQASLVIRGAHDWKSRSRHSR